MKTVYIIFSCLIAAKAVFSVQAKSTVTFLDYYNQNFDFINSFLSPREIDNLLLILRSERNPSQKGTYSNDMIYRTVQTLQQATIPSTSLHGVIIRWCTGVKNTIPSLSQSFNQLEYNNFAKNVSQELNELKSFLDSISTYDESKKNTIDYRAVITISNSVLKMNVSKGSTPDELLQWLRLLLESGRTEHNITENTTQVFNEKMIQAKKVVTEAFEVLHSDINHNLDREAVVEKCVPVLGKLTTSSTASPQNTPQPQMITPSKVECLKVYSNTCGNYLKDTCEVVLSRSSMVLLKASYKNDQIVAAFLDSINAGSSSNCKNSMASFIKNFNTSWEPRVPLVNTQYLKISYCLDGSTPVPNYTIVQ